MHKRFFSEQTRYRRRRKAQRRREQREAAHAAHPLRTSLPFLCLSGVVLAGAITAASCTLCYQVEAQGQPLAFFQDPGTYDQAVAQAEAVSYTHLGRAEPYGQAAQVRLIVTRKTNFG